MKFCHLQLAPMILFGLRNKLILFVDHYQTPCSSPYQPWLASSHWLCKQSLVQLIPLTKPKRTLVRSLISNSLCVIYHTAEYFCSVCLFRFWAGICSLTYSSKCLSTNCIHALMLVSLYKDLIWKNNKR